jgi:hypothetical protein
MTVEDQGYHESCKRDLEFPNHPVIPTKPFKSSCGGDNPWRERFKCAGFCIAMHLVYEGIVHWVLPALV